VSILHVGHIAAEVEKRFRGLIDLADVKDAEREDAFLRGDCQPSQSLNFPVQMIKLQRYRWLTARATMASMRCISTP
jgi:hypothetical protein